LMLKILQMMNQSRPSIWAEILSSNLRGGQEA
jgi:hypothetical protein